MLVIGSQFFRSGSDSDARQARARAALRALPDARPVNLQFADDPEPFEGLETAAVLRLDSRRVAGGDGPRKPIVSEMFDALASIARREHAGWFAYANADIEVT